MISDLKNLRSKIDQRKGERDHIEKCLSEEKRNLKNLEKRKKAIEEAETIVQTVAKMTQEELEYHISELVTLALEAVFPDPYELNLTFELRRHKTEADIAFSKDGERIDPITAAGGGAVDVAAFALRVALLTLKKPSSRNMLILDEPFRFLSTDLQPKAGEMLKEISERLNLQMIIVSHETELIEAADKVFEVTIKKGMSKIK